MNDKCGLVMYEMALSIIFYLTISSNVHEIAFQRASLEKIVVSFYKIIKCDYYYYL